MGRSRLILATVAMLLAAALPPLSGASGPVTHAAVFIQSDADFTAANGVVAGSGSPGDPYVIAGWRFSSNIGTTVIITNTSLSFVLRDNIFDGVYGVSIYDDNSTILITNNTFLVRSGGLSVARAEARIDGNAFIHNGASSYGISLTASSSVVVNNRLDQMNVGISVVAGGSPRIIANDLHYCLATGIYVHDSVDAVVQLNTLTDCSLGIRCDYAINMTIEANVMLNGNTGILIWVCKDVQIRNNTVRAEISVSVLFESSSGNFTGNVVIDGDYDGVQIWHSPFVLANNTISNNLGIGFNFELATATANNNTFVANGVGISVTWDSHVDMHGNVMVNNTVGFNIPYESRQSILEMSGNLVNGVNVDGTLVASEQVYFYHAANVQIIGQVRDSGFAAGYYGSLTAQGNVVLYEVDTASINASVISHANFGVYAINSFNVVVDGDLILQTGTGVLGASASANGTVGGPYGGGSGQVPPCAVAVKNTNITIPVDPTLTVGVDIRACLGIVRNSTISIVQTGIRFDQASTGTIEGNVVSNTNVGIDVGGILPLSVHANVVSDNQIGARFSWSNATVTNNTFEDNAVAGVQLAAHSWLQFRGNEVEGNGNGLVDTQDCSQRTQSNLPACSSITSVDNCYMGNVGLGVSVNGASTWQDDGFADNGGDGARLGDVTLTRVNASGNGGMGVHIAGDFVVRDSQFSANTRHGFDAQGGGELRRSNFTFNGEAGIHLRATYVQAFDTNVSFNFDGILFDEDPTALVTLPPTNSLGLNYILGLSPNDGNGPDPLDVHRSVLIGNERDAIHAGLALVNATSNYWGGDRPAISIADQVGAFQNGVSPSVRFIPWYADPQMSQSEPVPLL